MELRSRPNDRENERGRGPAHRHQLRDNLQRLLWSERPVELRHVDELFFVWPVLDSQGWLRLGAISIGSVDLDTIRGMDVAFERAVGMGALSLRAVDILGRTGMGVDTRLRITLFWLRLPRL